MTEPYVIAEIGANHNGDMGLARELIEAAADVGADAAKFQSWTDESLVSEEEYERNTSYAGDEHRHFGSLREMVEEYRLTRQDHEELREHCDTTGIDFMSSAFAPDEVAMLVELDAAAIKIASMDVNNFPLLEAAATSGVPVVLSTGMAHLSEIATAVEVLQQHDVWQLTLLHCVSQYPAAPDVLNLNNIPMLASATGLPVGFSDHSLGVAAATAAVALGATMIEKHFTLNKDLPGWDHWISADPDEMRLLVSCAHEAAAALGSDQRVLTPGDLEKRKQFRRSIVTRRPLKAGSVIEEADLALKRPGTGIEPPYMSAVIGRRATRDVPAGRVLDTSDVEGLRI